MYHQFKQLADIDITKEAMEVGPTTHYVMGGIRVDADTQMSTMPGLFAAGECASGINGANRLGGNSLSDLLVFGKRAGEYAAEVRREHDRPARTDGASNAARQDPRTVRARRSGENPYRVQSDLQDMMQDLVGIVRRENEMRDALTRIQQFKDGPRASASAGIASTPRLAHRARLAQPAHRLRGDHALRARAQGKPRRPLPRRLSGQDG